MLASDRSGSAYGINRTNRIKETLAFREETVKVLVSIHIHPEMLRFHERYDVLATLLYTESKVEGKLFQ